MKTKMLFVLFTLFVLVIFAGCKGEEGKCCDDSPTTPPVCTISVDIASHTFGCDGGSLRVRLLTPTGCTISGQVTSDQGWLSVSQSGNEFTAVAPRNESGAQRTANISINGVRVATYTQNTCSAPVPCVYTATPSSFSFDHQGRSGTITVLKSPASCLDCTTVPSGLPDWITIVYSGNGVFTYTVTTNTDSNNSREVIFTLCGSTVTIRQGPAPRSCNFTVTPSTTNFSCPGGTAMFNVVTQSGCSWFAETNSSWITITSGGSWINGSGVAAISVSQNGTSSRSGTVTVAGQNFTITQDACTTQFSCTRTGNASIPVTETFTCPNGSVQSATVTVTGRGSGTSNSSCDAAQAEADREAQAAADAQVPAAREEARRQAQAKCPPPPTCGPITAASTQDFTCEGGNGSVIFSGTPGCRWDASTTAPNQQLTFTGATSGIFPTSGGASVPINVKRNETGAARTLPVRINERTINVPQAACATACRLTAPATTQEFEAGGSTASNGSLIIGGPANTSFTVSVPAAFWSFVSVNGGQTQMTGTFNSVCSATIQFNVGGNNTGVARVGEIVTTSAGQSVTTRLPQKAN